MNILRIKLGNPAFNKNHTTNKIALLENVEKNEVVDWLKENEEDFSRVQWYVPMMKSLRTLKITIII